MALQEWNFKKEKENFLAFKVVHGQTDDNLGLFHPQLLLKIVLFHMSTSILIPIKIPICAWQCAPMFNTSSILIW